MREYKFIDEMEPEYLVGKNISTINSLTGGVSAGKVKSASASSSGKFKVRFFDTHKTAVIDKETLTLIWD